MDQMRLATWTSGLTPNEGLPSVFFSRQARALREYYSAQAAIEAAKSADVAANQASGTAAETVATTRRDEKLQELARALDPLLRAGTVPASLPQEWLTVMTIQGWLDAGLIPVKEELKGGEQEHQEEAER